MNKSLYSIQKNEWIVRNDLRRIALQCECLNMIQSKRARTTTLKIVYRMKIHNELNRSFEELNGFSWHREAPNEENSVERESIHTIHEYSIGNCSVFVNTLILNNFHRERSLSNHFSKENQTNIPTMCAFKCLFFIRFIMKKKLFTNRQNHLIFYRLQLNEVSFSYETSEWI